MISADSPDVWARQREFRFDATIGVPPDAFSETGQDWGLPPWRAHVMREGEFRWMKNRARRYAGLYDGYRIDHLVGLYRMYVRPIDKSRPSFFEPANEAAQTRLGETLVNLLRGTAGQVEVFAEDLGSVPAFVRESMIRLQLPGLKVLRWEKYWDREGQPPIDPATFPELSVATTGTHDIEPIAATPEGATEEQRKAVLQSLLSCRLGVDADPHPGRIRLDRSHQYAGRGRRHQLDVAPAVVRRLVARSNRDRGSRRRAQGLDPQQRAMTDEQPEQEPQEPQGQFPRPVSTAPPTGSMSRRRSRCRSCAARSCCSTSGPTAASTACTSFAT